VAEAVRAAWWNCGRTVAAAEGMRPCIRRIVCLTVGRGSGVIGGQGRAWPATQAGNWNMKLRPAPPDTNLVERGDILDAVGISRVLRRIAFEIVERNGPAPYLVGIRTGGAVLAERMVEMLAASGESRPVLGAIDITLYRDDVFLGLPSPRSEPPNCREH